MKDLTIGHGTFKALRAVYGVAEELLDGATHPEDIAICTARIAFLRSARVTKWKVYLPVPLDATTRAILAEDLADLGKPNAGLIPEFEKHSPLQMIRGAFARLAEELDTKGLQ